MAILYDELCSKFSTKGNKMYVDVVSVPQESYLWKVDRVRLQCGDIDL